MMYKLSGSILVLFLLQFVTPAVFAQSPDFSVCEDLEGAASGLCRAGIALGCDTDSSSNACNKISEQYERVTGTLPPFFGASISPTSGFATTCYLITDPRGELLSSDTVVFYLPGTLPTSGYPATIYPSLGELPQSLGGPVPSVPPDSYWVGVLASDTSLKLGPLDYQVLASDGGVVPCGR